MILLAIDCSASLCAACVYDGAAGRELGRAVRDLGKGHAEHLIAVVEEALAAAGKTYADLDAIAVSVGPGSFTGIRVAVSAARGFALALGRPAIGVNVLEALAAESRDRLGARTVLAALATGPHAAEPTVQAGLYDPLGGALHSPAILTLREAADLALNSGAALAGTAAGRIAMLAGGEVAMGVEGATADIGVYARVAAAKGAGRERPSPLYLREPDAKPQAGFVLPRRES
jgi:tRNA threonylcarbamoyladenosine biosynthesis protein TsaB